MQRSKQQYRSQAIGYLGRGPRWLCTHTNNFRYVTSSKQLLTKCLPRNCARLVDLYKLNETEKRQYLELLEAKQKGFWICQEKTITPSQNERRSDSSRQEIDQPTFSMSSDQRSNLVICPNCGSSYQVLPNQHVVFCECDYVRTNEAFLEED